VAQRVAEALRQEIRIDASPETVFPFFTDPARMTQWKGGTATLDPRPGGVYRVVINDRIIAAGEYVEVLPPTRVVFTWGWEGDHPVRPGSTTVEVELVPDGDGTLVRLTHHGLPDDEQRAQHAQGWTHYLGRLRLAATGRDPGPDPIARMENR
jgi:uncharacterized protein YndB with AHSA1/START domain